MATICFIWWNFCLWPENNIWNFESLVRHSDMGILRSGGVFVIRQYGWLVMKITKQIVVSSCVSWKNEHQTFPSLLAFLASHEAVLVLWYMCLVQLIIISFFFVSSIYFQRQPFICISFFDVWYNIVDRNTWEISFFILNCLRFVHTDRNFRKKAVNWEQVGYLYRLDTAYHCLNHMEGRPSNCKGIPQVSKTILFAWFYWELCLAKLITLTLIITF